MSPWQFLFTQPQTGKARKSSPVPTKGTVFNICRESHSEGVPPRSVASCGGWSLFNLDSQLKHDQLEFIDIIMFAESTQKVFCKFSILKSSEVASSVCIFSTSIFFTYMGIESGVDGSYYIVPFVVSENALVT